MCGTKLRLWLRSWSSSLSELSRTTHRSFHHCMIICVKMNTSLRTMSNVIWRSVCWVRNYTDTFPKQMTQTTGFIIPFMSCLQSTYRYLNKRALSELQQAVVWKCNLIISYWQISGLGCTQSILPWQIALLRLWCPLQPRTYVRVDSQPSLAWKLNTGTDCVREMI